jgi:H+/Cl- antiporter ClcA
MSLRRLLHFEGKNEPLLPRRHYYNRLMRNVLAGGIFLGIFLGIGIVGYHVTCGLDWLDSLLNASMILSGMGPTSPITTPAGKWFASLYALLSGVVFITTIGLVLAPIAHRVFHRFHLEEEG